MPYRRYRREPVNPPAALSPEGIEHARRCRGSKPTCHRSSLRDCNRLRGLHAFVADIGAGAPIVFDSRAAFESALGDRLTDSYSPLVYSVGAYDDAAMSAFFGETSYTNTGYPGLDLNFIVEVVPGDLAYCVGCSGSFELNFQATSVGTAVGVFGAGFNFWNDPDFVGSIDLYHAFVTFGDGSTQDVALPRVSPPGNLTGFFGIVSDTLIRSVHLGLTGGAPTNTGHFGLDNLTIGARPTAVPEPSFISLVAFAAAGVVIRARSHWRRHSRVE